MDIGKGKPIRRTTWAVRVAGGAAGTSNGEDGTVVSKGEPLEASTDLDVDSGGTSGDRVLIGDDDVVGGTDGG